MVNKRLVTKATLEHVNQRRIQVARSRAIHEVAASLATTCDQDTITSIINALLCSDDDDRLSDSQAEAASQLFDQLTQICPDAAVPA